MRNIAFPAGPPFGLILVLTLVFVCPWQPDSQASEASTTSTGLWADAEVHPEGWRYLPWFGWFVPDESGWIWHAEHGWQYYVGESTQSVHFHDRGINAWGWWADSSYPWMYWFAPVQS